MRKIQESFTESDIIRKCDIVTRATIKSGSKSPVFITPEGKIIYVDDQKNTILNHTWKCIDAYDAKVIETRLTRDVFIHNDLATYIGDKLGIINNGFASNVLDAFLLDELNWIRYNPGENGVESRWYCVCGGKKITAGQGDALENLLFDAIYMRGRTGYFQASISLPGNKNSNSQDSLDGQCIYKLYNIQSLRKNGENDPDKYIVNKIKRYYVMGNLSESRRIRYKNKRIVEKD